MEHPKFGLETVLPLVNKEKKDILNSIDLIPSLHFYGVYHGFPAGNTKHLNHIDWMNGLSTV